jgi:antitoxin (DNA-binding transcriptional repressor) of toxin-antitoxin stability system
MAVELTRRGEPVAVLIGWRRFERLALNRRSFIMAYRDFTNESDLTALALDPEELFAGTREETPGRDVRL